MKALIILLTFLSATTFTAISAVGQESSSSASAIHQQHAKPHHKANKQGIRMCRRMYRPRRSDPNNLQRMELKKQCMDFYRHDNSQTSSDKKPAKGDSA